MAPALTSRLNKSFVVRMMRDFFLSVLVFMALQIALGY